MSGNIFGRDDFDRPPREDEEPSLTVSLSQLTPETMKLLFPDDEAAPNVVGSAAPQSLRLRSPITGDEYLDCLTVVLSVDNGERHFIVTDRNATAAQEPADMFGTEPLEWAYSAVEDWRSGRELPEHIEVVETTSV